MQVVSQLLLLWLELSLGPITVQHNLFSRHGMLTDPDNPSSTIWVLDESSGSILASEGFSRSFRTLQTIDRVFDSLAESYNNFLIVAGLRGEQAVPAAPDHEIEWRVRKSLYQASSTHPNLGFWQRGDLGTAASLISFTALLTCFQPNQQDSLTLSAQRIQDIIKACAAIALRLREAFGDMTQSNDRVDTVQTACTPPSWSGACSFIEATCRSLIALTIIEAMAHTFEFLLVETNSGKASTLLQIGSTETSPVSISKGAGQVVAGRLGVIMGILCTVIDCFDNIPKRGRRANNIGARLGRLCQRLEELNVRPDISFAFDCAIPDTVPQPQESMDVEVKKEASSVSVQTDLVPSAATSAAGVMRSTFNGTEFRGERSFLWESPGSTQYDYDSLFEVSPYFYPYANHSAAMVGPSRYGPGLLSTWLPACVQEGATGATAPTHCYGLNQSDIRLTYPSVRDTSLSEEARFAATEQLLSGLREPLSSPPRFSDAPRGSTCVSSNSLGALDTEQTRSEILNSLRTTELHPSHRAAPVSAETSGKYTLLF